MNMAKRVLFPLLPVVAVLGALALSSCVSRPVAPQDQTRQTLRSLPGSATVGSAQYVFADAPVANGYPNSWTVLVSVGYESAYDETFKNPAWVAYHISGVPIWDPGSKRPPYRTDERSTSLVSSKDYPPGYDVGHMACNETIGQFFGSDGQRSTFLMTNMVPQRHGLNAGPWKSVETEERTDWVTTYHDLWTIAGPVYTNAPDEPVNPAMRYGVKQICIPVACFKIVVARDSAGAVHAVAYIMPQEHASGHKPKEFAVSIREVERRTGLNFFSGLPVAVQDRIELEVNKEL
ncbi:hypothetical protein DB347_20345 [Opitutaceae bacterium EW11]|nr:hypothetical protein DB347_20345 [Opitutaceae bacterium EW11]